MGLIAPDYGRRLQTLLSAMGEAEHDDPFHFLRSAWIAGRLRLG